jgi:hypothetical protein
MRSVTVHRPILATLRNHSYSRGMAGNARPRLFVSPPHANSGPTALRVLQRLEPLSYAFSWSPIGRAEPSAIGPAICASDAVLVFVNIALAASTYHSIELSFALGEASYEGQPPLPSPPRCLRTSRNSRTSTVTGSRHAFERGKSRYCLTSRMRRPRGSMMRSVVPLRLDHINHAGNTTACASVGE